MEKIKNTLGVSKGGGMSGIGTDQSALLEDPEFKKAAEEGANFEDPNSASRSNIGPEQTVPEHKSALLNKLDPRIGFTPEEIDENLEQYEKKYGKPKEGFLEKRDEVPGSKMGGIGSDQSALVDVDAEGHK